MLLHWLGGMVFVNLVSPLFRDTSTMMNWSLAYVAVIVVVMVYESMNRNLARERDIERDRLAHMAMHDQLTGLANRAMFEEQWRAATYRSERAGKKLALLYIDLDGFKGVNDRLGHLAGDFVLQRVAEHLTRGLRKMDFVARMGGDEFAVILESVQHREDAAEIAEKLRALILQPIAYEQRDATVGASLGIALFPDDGASADAVVSHADALMYQRKRAAKMKAGQVNA